MLPKARKKQLVIERIPDETLVYDLERDRAHCLNHTAGMVWEYCDGRTSVAQMAARLAKATGASANEDVVWLALNSLDKAYLLEPRLETGSKHRGFSRREALKKFGRAAVVSLPVVFSIVAPTAAQAASCVEDPAGCDASTLGQCCCGGKACRFSGGKFNCGGAKCTA